VGVEKRIKVGNSNIGTNGSETGMKGGGDLTSTEGGQYPFLPACSTLKTGLRGGSRKSGTTVQPSGAPYPNLPKSRPSGLRKGK
jgi:hypothetical protein